MLANENVSPWWLRTVESLYASLIGHVEDHRCIIGAVVVDCPERIAREDAWQAAEWALEAATAC